MRLWHILLVIIIVGLATNAVAVKPVLDCDADGDGSISASRKCDYGPDCDDGDAAVNPYATEECDGIDNNCDGNIDEGCPEPPPEPTRCDQDADGYEADSRSCKGDDCNDNDWDINPGADEICDDGIDNNCDGNIDEGCSPCTDADSDNWTDCDGDCDDDNASVYPGAEELCDGLDNNCDGSIDEDLSTDADGDVHYTPASCLTPNDDCDDSDPSVHPGATEICNDGIDNNCDGNVDEDCTAPGPLPLSMAAAGDSITVAFNADGTRVPFLPFLGFTFDQFEVSWALGDSSRVNSHAQRLWALNPGFSWDAEFDNYAESGANIADLLTQITGIVENGPYDYVVIFIGHNDICDASAPGEMLSEDTFDEHFLKAITYLYDQDKDGQLDENPPQVVVSSLARVSDLYDVGESDDWCKSIWENYDICRVVTSGNLDYIAAADARTQLYNAKLESHAATFGYTFVPQIYETQFTLDDLSDADCFHPNVSGQNTISEIIWNNGPYGQ